MHPAGAVAVEAAGGPATDVRAAARAVFILGLAMASVALLAATINPGGFHAQIQIIEQAAPAPAPGAQSCAATEAEAQDLRGNAMYLVLMGVAQAVVAAAADVALVGSLPMPIGRCLTAWAYLMGAINAWCLCDVVNGAAVVAIGHCAGGGYLVAVNVLSYVLIALSYASLLGVSLATIICF